MTPSLKAVWLLGLTQILGYGTLYYSFSILADDIAKSFGWTQAGFFGVFSLALLAGGASAAPAGRALDRMGAARMMALGSALSGASLLATAAAPGPITFALALVITQVVSCLVLYDAAFTALVQIDRTEGQKRIVHLTLIAGFASSLFWPLTGLLDHAVGWRVTLAIYGACNLLLCVPAHAAIASWLKPRLSQEAAEQDGETGADAGPGLPAESLKLAMVLVTLGFALSSFALSAVLSQMVPLLQALGFGAASLAVSVLFGPAQVVVRFTNMIFGAGRHPLTIAIVALLLLPLALVVVALGAPAHAAALVFVVLVGLSSGLKSIVQGTVPLVLFGAQGYGARLGVMASFRFVLAALAPFSFAAIAEMSSPATAAFVTAGVGAAGVLALVAVRQQMGKVS